MEFKISGENIGSNIFIDNEREKDGILCFDVNMILENSAPQEFEITFRTPDIDIYSVWSPSLRFDRRLGPVWGKRKSESSLASWMPVHSLVSVSGQNRMTVALSDAENPMTIASGECEDDATIVWCITFHTKNVDPNKPYKATVRIDTRDIPFYESIYDVTAWWEDECGYKPAHIPEHAKLPMNSLWYSYHYDLDAEDIIKEAALSKELGMETVIVDDGWQTDDNNRSYKYCGDWQVAFSKFPDMKKFVDRVHDTGMKIMLWFSVPFIGIAAKNFERFKSYLLSEVSDDIEFYAFDPRYKEVRDYLLGMYVKAVKEWGFDGLKLDFIDEFVLNSKKALEFDPRRDYQSLEEAIDRLMTDVTDALRAINPEVLIEFRQTYVGPAIRKYGNMLRVGDCANDALFNRAEIPSLKLTSGNHAVHSDMLMWNYEDKVESAALEFVSVLYAVPQISMKIAKLRDDHKQMLKFYLSFWRENRDILLEGKFGFANHESVTSIAWAEKNGKAIITTYTDSSVCVSEYPSAIVVNASRHPSIIIKGADGKKYKVNDCMGNILEEGTVCGTLCEIKVPLSGMICID